MHNKKVNHLICGVAFSLEQDRNLLEVTKYVFCEIFKRFFSHFSIKLPKNLPKLFFIYLDIGRIKDVASGGTVCLALNEVGFK